MTDSQPQLTYSKTMADGLAALTDLTLQNSNDLAEVRELIYGRYALEDEKRAACDTKRGDLRDQLAKTVELLTERLREPRTSESADDQIRRLLEEMKVLQQQKADSVRQFMDGCKAMQDYHAWQAMTAIQDLRSQRQHSTRR